VQTLTNSNGDYTISNLPEGTGYIVTPTKTGLTFTPPQAGGDLFTDRTFDFTAVQLRYSINVHVETTAIPSGTTKLGDAQNAAFLPPAPTGPFPLRGVTITITGNGGAVSTTNFDGNLSQGGLLPGDYTITPSKAGYTFNPPSASATITAQNVNQNFTGSSPGLDGLTGRITFDFLGSIKSMNANGSGETVVIGVNRFTSFSEPSVTSDGLKINGVSATPSSIFTANTDGTGRVNIRRASGLHSPAWSPNGSKIAFVDSVSQTLRTMNSNGTNVATVTSNCIDPDWASDNTNIVCVRDRSLLMTQSGTLFTSPFNLSSPKFSPDGSKIALINGGAIEVMNSNGSGRTTIIPRDTFGSRTNLDVAWSPDGARLAYVQKTCGGTGQCIKKAHSDLAVADSNQQDPLTIDDDFAGTTIDWSLSPGFPTNAGSNVTVGTGGANIRFPAVGNAGITNIIPISPASAGQLPNGFVVGGQAFDISTTASFTPLITVCITMPIGTTLDQFTHTFLLHNENGVLVDRTTMRNFAILQICGQVASLSPFVVAEQVDPSLPSITGIGSGREWRSDDDVAVHLSGAEDRTTTTDVDGQFVFADLTEGANYNVQPKLPGLIFTEYSQDLLNLSGENTLVFTGTQGAFDIGGRVTDVDGNGLGGITISLVGTETDQTVTDANGDYAFNDLPVDGNYVVTPSGGPFGPAEIPVSALISDINDANFVQLVLATADVSIGGRVTASNGRGIANARVVFADSQGDTRSAYTNSFGYYRVFGLTAGQAYDVDVSSKGYEFTPLSLFAVDSIDNFDIIGTINRSGRRVVR
jgi:hypothetical protein